MQAQQTPKKSSKSFNKEFAELIRDYALTGKESYVIRAGALVKEDGSAHFSKKTIKWFWIFHNCTLSPMGFDVRTISPIISSGYSYEDKKHKLGFLKSCFAKFSCGVVQSAFKFQAKVSVIPESARDWVELVGIKLYFLFSEQIQYNGDISDIDPQFKHSTTNFVLTRLRKISKTHPEHAPLIKHNLNLWTARCHIANHAKARTTSRLNRTKSFIKHSTLAPRYLESLRLEYLRVELESQPSLDYHEVRSIIEDARRSFHCLSPVTVSAIESFHDIIRQCADYLSDLGFLRDAAIEYRRCLRIHDLWKLPDTISVDHTKRKILIKLSRILQQNGRFKEAAERIRQALELVEIELEKANDLRERLLFEAATLRANRALLEDESARVVSSLTQCIQTLESLVDQFDEPPTASNLFQKGLSPLGFGVALVKKDLASFQASQSSYQRARDLASLSQNDLDTAISFYRSIRDLLTLSRSDSEEDKSLYSNYFEGMTLNEISDPSGILLKFFDSVLKLCSEENPEYAIEIVEVMRTRYSQHSYLVTIAGSSLATSIIAKETDLSLILIRDSVEHLERKLSDNEMVVPDSFFHIIDSYSRCLESSPSKKYSQEMYSLLPKIRLGLDVIESARSTYLDKDDRSAFESFMKNSYQLLGKGLITQLDLGHLQPNELLDLAQLAVVFTDRADHRWALSLASEEPDNDTPPENIPKELRDQYLQTRERLFYSRPDFSPPRNDEDANKITEFAKVAASRSYARFGIVGDNHPTEINEENYSYPQSSYEEFIKIVERIQISHPNFEPNIVKNIGELANPEMLRAGDESQLHLSMVSGRLLILFYGDDCNFKLLPADFSGRLESARESFEAWLTVQAAEAQSPSPAEEVWKLPEDLHLLLKSLLNNIKDVTSPPSALERHSTRVFIAPSLGWIPVHALDAFIKEDNSPGSGLFATYTPSMALLRPSCELEHNTPEIVMASSFADLPFSHLESLGAWPSTSFDSVSRDPAWTRDSITAAASEATIFHYCGHQRIAPEDRLSSYLEGGNGDRITLKYCLNSLKFRNRPLVILNACRTASTQHEAVESLQNDKVRLSFSEGVNTEQFSFTTAFMIAGASSVVSTLWEVDDLPAALFAWKLSKLLGEPDSQPLTAFTKAVRWMRDDISTGLILSESIFPEFVRDAKLNNEPDGIILETAIGVVEDTSRKHPHSPPFAHPRHWAAFVFNH